VPPRRQRVPGRDGQVEELLHVADDLASSRSELEALIDEIAAPLAEKGPRDVPSALAASELLELARDRALDALLPEGSDAR